MNLKEKLSAWYKRNKADVNSIVFLAAVTGAGLGWNATVPKNEWYAPRLTNYCVRGVADSEAGMPSRTVKAFLVPVAVAADPTYCLYRGLDKLIED